MNGFIKLSLITAGLLIASNSFASGPAPFNGATVINNSTATIQLSYSVCSKDFSYCTLTSAITLDPAMADKNETLIPYENSSQALLITSATSSDASGKVIAHMDNQCKVTGDNTVAVLNTYKTDRIVCQLGM